LQALSFILQALQDCVVKICSPGSWTCEHGHLLCGRGNNPCDGALPAGARTCFEMNRRRRLLQSRPASLKDVDSSAAQSFWPRCGSSVPHASRAFCVTLKRCRPQGSLFSAPALKNGNLDAHQTRQVGTPSHFRS
jgi:hypothetical protein